MPVQRAGILASLRNRELVAGGFAQPLNDPTFPPPHGQLARQLCNRLYKRTPARLTVPMRSLLAQAPLLSQCVALGFSRCGGFLYSYSFDANLRFELQVRVCEFTCCFAYCFVRAKAALFVHGLARDF